METALSADTQMILDAVSEIAADDLSDEDFIKKATKAVEDAIRSRARESLDSSDWAVSVLREITSLYVREKIAS